MKFPHKFIIVIGLSILIGFIFSSSNIINVLAKPLVRQSPDAIEYNYEAWSFNIDNYAIEHQGKATLNIEVSYQYRKNAKHDYLKYPNFVPVYEFINKFLVSYPNETDYWEILNKKLVKSLLIEPMLTAKNIKYKLADVVDSLTVKIDIKANSSDLKIPRSSIVTGKPPQTS
jgi:hypothetical protein